MYVIKNTANGRYYRKLGAETHQYVGIENATPFSKWKKAKQKADILHASISPIGEQVNFKVEQSGGNLMTVIINEDYQVKVDKG